MNSWWFLQIELQFSAVRERACVFVCVLCREVGRLCCCAAHCSAMRQAVTVIKQNYNNKPLWLQPETPAITHLNRLPSPAHHQRIALQIAFSNLGIWSATCEGHTLKGVVGLYSTYLCIGWGRQIIWSEVLCLLHLIKKSTKAACWTNVLLLCECVSFTF